MDGESHECSKNSVGLDSVYNHVEKTVSNSKDVHDLEFVLLSPDEFDKDRDDYRIPSPDAFEGDAKNSKQYLNCCKFPSTSSETLGSISAPTCEHSSVENVFDEDETTSLPFTDKVNMPSKCSETENISSSACETSKPVISSVNEDEPLLSNIDPLVHREDLHNGDCNSQSSSMKSSSQDNDHEKAGIKDPESPLKYALSVPDHYTLDGTQNRFIHVTLLNNLESGPCTLSENILGESHILTIPKLHSCLWMDCDTHFLSVSDLSNHVTSAHIRATKEQTFHCMWKDCVRNGKSFNARYKMLSHIRTHTGEKPHVCVVHSCDKSFARLENLKIHMRTHTGEKPYKCPYEGCTKSYANSSDRFKHTKIHYDKKPFHCKSPGCNKSYTDPSSLRKHSKSHMK